MAEPPVSPGPAYERALLASMTTGALLCLVGTLGVLSGSETLRVVSLVGSIVGLVLLLVALLLSLRVAYFQHAFPNWQAAGGPMAPQNWTRLKASALLLDALTLFASVLLILSLLARMGAIRTQAPFGVVLRVTVLLSFLFAANLTATLWFSLRAAFEPSTLKARRPLAYAGVGIALVFSLVSLALATQSGGVAERLELLEDDIAFFVLAAYASASIALVFARGVPSVRNLFSHEHQPFKGRQFLTAAKSTLVPALIALGLLLVEVLVLVLVGTGAPKVVGGAADNAGLIVALVFTVLLLLASFAFAVRLGRREEKVELYRTHPTREKQTEEIILAGSVSLALLIVVAALFVATGRLPLPIPTTRWIDFLSIALMVGLGPYGFYYAHKRNRIKKLEERFPDFLRDIASSRRSGLTLTTAVAISTRGEYGALNPEIKRMADQLSWNVSFEEALTRFGRRVSTPLVERAVSLINEAGRSGGRSTDVLLAAARDAREIKNLENERAITMTLYTIIIYVSFFVFLGIVGVLYGSFVPEIVGAAEKVGNSAAATGFSFGGISAEEFRVFYFTGALMQGIGGGIVAGVMENGRAAAGLRHAFIMVFCSYLTFAILLV